MRMRSECRVLLTEDVDPYRNMACEEALLLAVESGLFHNIIRFWVNRRSVILGLSQKVSEEVDLNACTKYDVCVLKRFTGGGAVYQDLGNLNWTFIREKGQMRTSRLFEMYRELSEPILAYLRSLQLNPQFKGPNNIFIGDKKISGMAMCVKRNTVLCHGTLLVNSDLKILKSVLKNIKYDVMNISRDKTLSIKDIINNMITNINKTYDITVDHKLNKVEEKLFNKILKEKYNPS